MARMLTWYPADGRSPIVLTDRAAGRRVLKGTRGLGAGPVELVTDDSPLLDGTTVWEPYYAPRVITLPMLVSARTRAEFLSKVRELVTAIHPDADGELELAQHDGRRFRLRCRYLEGLEGDEDTTMGGDTTWWRFILKLYAADPWWYGEPITATFTPVEAVPFFPLPPLRLSRSQVLGTVTVHNPGDVTAWPTWSATAPGSDPEFRNLATGETLRFAGALPAGQTLTVVTTPGQQSVTLTDGTSWWPQWAPGSVMWRIPPGTTRVSLTLASAGVGSEIALSFRPRYRTPW